VINLRTAKALGLTIAEAKPACVSNSMGLMKLGRMDEAKAAAAHVLELQPGGTKSEHASSERSTRSRMTLRGATRRINSAGSAPSGFPTPI
jgi:hypothetical protein